MSGDDRYYVDDYGLMFNDIFPYITRNDAERRIKAMSENDWMLSEEE